MGEEPSSDGREDVLIKSIIDRTSPLLGVSLSEMGMTPSCSLFSCGFGSASVEEVAVS